MGGLIDMEWKGYQLIIHDHDRDPVGNHGGVGVPDSDWGNFRLWRVVNISSFGICWDCYTTSNAENIYMSRPHHP